MKLAYTALAVLLFTVLLMPICDTVNIDEYAPDTSSLSELYDALSDEAKAVLEDIGVTRGSYEELSDMSVRKVIGVFFSLLTTGLWDRLSFVLKAASLLLISACASSFAPDNRAVSLTGFCACGLTVFSPFLSAVSGAAGAVGAASAFIKLFIPIFAAAAAVSGNPSQAASYAAALLGFSQVAAYIAKNALVPLLGMLCAVSLGGSLYSGFDGEKIASAIRKTVTLLLGCVCTVFTGVLSLTGALSKAADSLAVKSAKFLIGSAIPVVGGAVSEAFSSITSGLGVVRAAVGVFGIIGVAVVFLPSFIELVSWLIAISVLGSVAKALGCEQQAALFKGLGSASSLLLSVLVMMFAVFAVTAGRVLSV